MMKINFLISFILISISLFAQTDTNSQKKTITKISSSNEIYNTASVHKKPEFASGEIMMNKFLKEYVAIPPIARDNGITGKVIVSFIVEKDGTLSDILVVRGIGAGCDQEALNVVKLMPTWNPGELNGEIVRVKYTLVVPFYYD